jgi:outer membrane protein OmpA-like peptidoglycan-associated protein
VAAKPAAPASIRLLFARDQTDLNSAGIEAIKTLIKTASSTGITVSAYADGAADDPSSGRRLSLARATAVRKALLDSGVPSNQITVRALGGRVGDGPPDRVDIITGNATGTP